jgi:hypothetical protein
VLHSQAAHELAEDDPELRGNEAGVNTHGHQ